MIKKQKIIKIILPLLLVVATSIGIQLSAGSTSVSAWCNDSESWSDNKDAADCYFNNMEQATSGDQSSGSKVTTTQYSTMVKACMDNGGSDAGACSNATLSCLRYTMGASQCSNGKYTGAIADDCNAGRLDDELLCDPIAKANYDSITAIEDSTVGNVTCTGSETSADAVKKCNAAVASAKTQCAKDSNLYVDPTTGNRKFTAGGGSSNGASVKSVNSNDYQNCLKKKVIEQLGDDPQACASVDGVWVDKDTVGSDGKNAISKGCYFQGSDLTNPDACAAANAPGEKRYEWKRTGGGTHGDDYGCVDAQNPDGKDADNPEDKTIDNLDGLGGTGKKCGKAETVLISCEGEGIGALGDVLKIFISVLSVIIGIAAVGGLAWASILYAKAEDNASSVSEARELIRNIVIGILLYGFLVAIVNWLVPGGVIG